ncbi:MAG: beta-ketoacyl-ACP synthase III [Actinomycetota bacterium]
MTQGRGRFAAVAATGSALPERVVPNSYFESLVETSDEWIVDRTGIRERRFAGDGETTATLSTEAARRTLDAAGMAPEQLDLIVVATVTPDRLLPSVAVMVQDALGVSCPAFDINAACAGFSYGTSVVRAMIESGAADNVVLVGAETLSRRLNMEDRSTCVLFGDGAGAALFVPSPEAGVMATNLAADGRVAKLLTIPVGGTALPDPDEPPVDKIVMQSGKDVYRRAVVGMTDACRSLIEKSGVTADDVRWLIPHQANARIMKTVADRLGFGADRVISDVDRIGNTSAASIPIALDEAWRAGLVRPGELVLMTSFGAGLAWGASLIRWTAPAFEAAA